ncbi:hypothetical protein HYV85_06145 [Candidatus Woesearchaeota archaeon]|nr:hypothetical protein [Candidatus Woesearchaeota archaeon]MBI3037416.1 hypothetical protein [Candidatus Woesearchaeota archaeon]
MPDASLVITLTIVVVSALVIFKVAKGMIQGLLLAGTIVSILAAVAGGFVVKDALELKDTFQKGNNTLLLSDDNWAKLTAGITINGLAADGKEGSAETLTAAELEELNAHFAKKDYVAMRGKNYKLIIVRESSVTGSVPGSGGKELPGSKSEERAATLAALLILKASRDPVFIISEYKKGNVLVYPETPVFKAIKLIPLSFFRKAAGKAFRQGADVTKGL